MAHTNYTTACKTLRCRTAECRTHTRLRGTTLNAALRAQELPDACRGNRCCTPVEHLPDQTEHPRRDALVRTVLDDVCALERAASSAILRRGRPTRRRVLVRNALLRLGVRCRRLVRGKLTASDRERVPRLRSYIWRGHVARTPRPVPSWRCSSRHPPARS